MIFLATSQWFIRMDGEPVIRASADATGEPRTLRASGLEAIDRDVKWIPAGAAIGSSTCSRTVRTGVSPASAPGGADSRGRLRQMR